jgi:hypothetical protein
MADLSAVPDVELWAELERRRAALHVGWAYPAAATDKENERMVEQLGYEFGPWQFMEIGSAPAAEPPSWKLYVDQPPQYRRPQSGREV